MILYNIGLPSAPNHLDTTPIYGTKTPSSLPFKQVVSVGADDQQRTPLVREDQGDSGLVGDPVHRPPQDTPDPPMDRPSSRRHANMQGIANPHLGKARHVGQPTR